MKKIFKLVAVALGMFGTSNAAIAQDVWITSDLPFFEIELNGEFVLIERNQDNNATIPAAFAKTSRACPPFCIHPMSAGDGVITVGEIELLGFLQTAAINGNAYIVDARTPNFYKAGTIPGAINLPFNLFTPSDTNPFLTPMLTQLGGAQNADGSWDFSRSASLLLFCNGPWCDQSPRAIRNLLELGYPAQNLFYYRGGVQSWLSMGLTIVVP